MALVGGFESLRRDNDALEKTRQTK